MILHKWYSIIAQCQIKQALIYLIKFLDLILGALMEAPRRLAPVMKIPLLLVEQSREDLVEHFSHLE
jgi:hypothetical protein